MPLIGISAVVEETGIHPSSLRRWENLGLLRPRRLDCGGQSIRVYFEDDVALLKTVKALLDEGYKLTPAFRKAKEQFTNSNTGGLQ